MPTASASASSWLSRIGLGALGVVVWIASWQWATGGGPLTARPGLPTASATFAVATQLVSSGSFWTAVGATFGIALVSLVIASVIGITLGVAVGRSETANAVLDPIVQFVRPLPPVVLLPLFLLLVGPSTELALILSTFAATWPILVQAQAGVRAADPVTMDTARALVLPWWRTQVHVVIPSALPFILTGIRIGATSALLLAVGTGILAGAPGLGKLLAVAQELGDADRVFAIILWSGVLGLALTLVLEVVERRILRNRRAPETA